MFMSISQSVLGFLDFIINFIVNLVMWLFKVAVVKIMPVIWSLLGPILGIIIKLLATVCYAVLMLIFLIMDMLELMFRRISGLESFPGAVTFDGTAMNYSAGEDLVLTFIKTPQIQRIFWTMATVAVVLLLISTIIAIIRTEYADEKTGNSKGPIFGRALKAIALFFTVPIACTAGLMIANLLLKIVDNVTKGSNSVRFSGMVFYAVANSSNRFTSDNFCLVWSLSDTLRAKGTFFSDNQQQPFTSLLQNGSTLTGSALAPEKILGIKFLDAMTATNILHFEIDRNRAEMAAEIVNTAFKYQIVFGEVVYNQATREWVGEISNNESGTAGKLCKELSNFTYGSGPYNTIKDEALSGASALGLDSTFADTMKMQTQQTITQTAAVVGSQIAKGFTVYNLELVFYFYDCIIFNYILGVLIGTTVLKVLLDLCMGCAVRLYKLVTLYAISPAIIALMPLDEKPFQQWTKKFVGLITGLYGGVVAMNMFFMISPLVYKINFFADVQAGTNPDLKLTPALTSPAFIKALNYLPQMLMVAAGAVSIRGISEMISGLIGAEDTLKEGAGATAAATSAIKGAASLAMGPAAMAAKMAAKTAGAAAGVAGAAADGLTGGLISKAKDSAHNLAVGKDGHGGIARGFRKLTGNETAEEKADSRQRRDLKRAVNAQNSADYSKREIAKMDRHSALTQQEKATGLSDEEQKEKAKLDRHMSFMEMSGVSKSSLEKDAKKYDKKVAKIAGEAGFAAGDAGTFASSAKMALKSGGMGAAGRANQLANNAIATARSQVNSNGDTKGVSNSGGGGYHFNNKDKPISQQEVERRAMKSSATLQFTNQMNEMKRELKNTQDEQKRQELEMKIEMTRQAREEFRKQNRVKMNNNNGGNK